MKRHYAISITISSYFEIDEKEIREKCEIPDDEEIDEEVWEGWVQDMINEYIEKKHLDEIDIYEIDYVRDDD